MNKIAAFAFDLDGTIYQGNDPVKGAADTIAALTDSGYQIFYFTNNSRKTRRQVVNKLIRLGFPAGLQSTYCASTAILKYLKEKKIKDVFLVGSRDLRNELLAHGIKVMKTSRVSAVVVGLDTAFNHKKIEISLAAINNGAKLIVANCDPSYPAGRGKRLPGCAAMVGAISSAASRKPDFIIGKPNTYMLELLCREHGFYPREICVVGDSPESDIKMARNFGCRSILFDPGDRYPDFSGRKAKRYSDIAQIAKKRR